MTSCDPKDQGRDRISLSLKRHIVNRLPDRRMREECQAISELEEFLEAVLWHSLNPHFYTRKQLLLSARLSRNSVCPSVRSSVRHTGGSVKNGAS